MRMVGQVFPIRGDSVEPKKCITKWNKLLDEKRLTGGVEANIINANNTTIGLNSINNEPNKSYGTKPSFLPGMTSTPLSGLGFNMRLGLGMGLPMGLGLSMGVAAASALNPFAHTTTVPTTLPSSPSVFDTMPQMPPTVTPSTNHSNNKGGELYMNPERMHMIQQSN